jgi:hypothetical protein
MERPVEKVSRKPLSGGTVKRGLQTLVSLTALLLTPGTRGTDAPDIPFVQVANCSGTPATSLEGITTASRKRFLIMLHVIRLAIPKETCSQLLTIIWSLF